MDNMDRGRLIHRKLRGNSSSADINGVFPYEEILKKPNVPNVVRTCSNSTGQARISGEKRGNYGGSSSGGRGGDQVRQGTRIFSERERRKRMRNMYSDLHSLLPNVHDQEHKVDSSIIVEEAVNYIKTLQTTLESLQKHKHENLHQCPSPTKIQQDHDQHLDLSLVLNQSVFQNTPLVAASYTPPPYVGYIFQTFVSQQVVMRVTGEYAQISVCCSARRKPGLMVTIAFVLDKFNLQVVSSHISTDGHLSSCMIHARASRCWKDVTCEGMKTEDVFKLAAEEIAALIGSPSNGYTPSSSVSQFITPMFNP